MIFITELQKIHATLSPGQTFTQSSHKA